MTIRDGIIYKPCSLHSPLRRVAVADVLGAPYTGAEGNLCETVRLLVAALLQASDAPLCPCCGGFWPAEGGAHGAGCAWPELVRLGYVEEGERGASEVPPPVAGMTPGCCCGTCPVTDCAEHQQAVLLCTPDPADLAAGGSR